MKNVFMKAILVTAVMIGIIWPVYSVSASESAMDDSWKFAAELYLWGASIGGTTATGSDVEVDFDDILDSMEMAFMGAVAMNKGKWTLAADLIYLNVEDSTDTARGVEASAEVTNWVISPYVGYNLVDTGKGRFDLLGGARYLYLKPELGIDALGKSAEESKSIWDAVIGVRGSVDFAKNFFLFGLFDVGTGDSDVTLQALGGVGYRFEWFNLVAAYRYMGWDFGDDVKVLDDMDIQGPLLGIQFTF